MAEMENSKDLISVLWSGADILRSKMDGWDGELAFAGEDHIIYFNKKNMSELESMIEEKLIEQLIYGDSQWNNFSESIKVSKYQAK